VGEKSLCITLPGRFVTSDVIGSGPPMEKREERVVKKSVFTAKCLMVRQVLHSGCVVWLAGHSLAHCCKDQE